ncbi:PREDICTED: translation initiation factor IF-2-like [Ceratotherium simum simum]|uniref:Translation initiation factor IF-2-like n=1 Tax=Ceratotherium simum simum TaxID=73337 RepID=A0ABM1D7I9_CERSS|nr:PREDICTED: translation initiation factor IF-2-like [Ceratotherium simum simum]
MTRQPPSEAPGRPLEEGPQGAGVGHPTSGTRPCPPLRPAAPLLKVQSRPRSAPPRALPGRAQPVRLGPDQDSTPGKCRRTQAGEGALQSLPRGLGHFPSQQTRPESSPKRHEPSRRPAPLAAVSAARHRSWAVITSQEKLPTPHGAALPAVDTPREPTHDPSRAQGRPPRQRQFLTGQKCPGASRDGRLRAPRPAPAAPPLRPRLTVSSAAAAGRRRTGRGRHNMAERRSCSGGFQQPPPARRGTEQAAAAAVAAAEHHIPLPLASSPFPRPPPLPWQRGAKEISPAPPARPRLSRPLGRGARPAPPRPVLSPPTSYRRAGPGTPQAAQNGGWGRKGDAVFGRAGLARKAGRRRCRLAGFRLTGWGRRENGKASPVPGTTYRSAAGRGAASEWPRWQGAGRSGAGRE